MDCFRIILGKNKSIRWLIIALLINALTLFACKNERIEKAVCNEEIISPNATQQFKETIGKYKKIILKEMKTAGFLGIGLKADLPGASVVIVNKDEILWAAGFGFTDRQSHKPVDTKTIFSIQSNSKTFTAMGVLTAVRDGLVDLDESITTYLPDFTVNSRFEEHPERKMTLRHLLSHRAGFTHEAPVGNNYYVEFASFDEHIKSISDTWLRYPVGDHYAYSNLGVDVAGYILQKVSGKPFWDYIKESVLDPIGMHGSSFDWEVIRNTSNRAVGHTKGYDEVPLEFGLIPAGGMYSSAIDMAEFLQFHLNGGIANGKKLLSDDLIEEMYTIQFPVKGQITGYCLGLGSYLRNNFPCLNHNGGGFGFLSHTSWFPEQDIGIVMLTNSTDHSLINIPLAIIDEIAGLKAGKERIDLYEERDAIALNDSTINKLVGNYIGRSISINAYMKKDAFGLKMGNNTFLPVTFVGKNGNSIDCHIIGQNGRELVRFVVDDEGKPKYMILCLGGGYLDYNDGPSEPAGPDRPEWDQYTGTYEFWIYGSRNATIKVSRKNGYLYRDNLKLSEYKPGLFFSSIGESLDLRGDNPSWRSIRLVKK